MRILHTSDWHLGQKFIGRSREEEHTRMLEWLLAVVVKEKPDLLLVAGDVFDTHNPPNASEEQYYGFLAGMLKTGCKNIIIIGGNHDSPSKLEASSPILRHLNIHIVAKAPTTPEECVVPVFDGANNLLALVAAVPFLLDRELGEPKSGETLLDKHHRIQNGIRAYYQATVGGLTPSENVPCIAMGHLFATGASAGDEQKNIYVGNIFNISASDFPSEFDYVALGHIHRPQEVGGQKHIRYCGSPIPLSFSEIGDQKQVVLVEFFGKKIVEVRAIQLPTFRQLLRIQGSLEEVLVSLQALSQHQNPLSTWAEVIVKSDAPILDLEKTLHQSTNPKQLEIVKYQNDFPRKGLTEMTEVEKLSDLTPFQVFEKLLDNQKTDEETRTRRQQQFAEIFEDIINQE